MTPRTAHRLEMLDLSVRAFARVTGIWPETAYSYGKDGKGEPAWIDYLLTAWETSPTLRMQALDKARQAIEDAA
jgi:hypothetical protein